MGWPADKNLQAAVISGVAMILFALTLALFNFGMIDVVVILTGFVGVAGGMVTQGNSSMLRVYCFMCSIICILYGIVAMSLFVGEEATGEHCRQHPTGMGCDQRLTLLIIGYNCEDVECKLEPTVLSTLLFMSTVCARPRTIARVL